MTYSPSSSQVVLRPPGRAHRPGRHDGALFRSFFERSGLRVAHLGRDLRVVEANADFQRTFGGTRRALSGTAFTDVIHRDHRARVGDRLAALVDEPDGGLLDEQVVARCAGRMLACRLRALVVPGEIEALDGVIVMVDLDDHDHRETAPGRHPVLSEVDARILEGVGVGVSTMQLAASLFLSRGGVEYHVKSLMQRFKVKNRPALISKAYSTGIFRVGYWPPQVPCHLVR